MIALEASARNPRSVTICSVGSPLYRTIFLVIAIAAGPASRLCAPTPITSRHGHNLDEMKAQHCREAKTSKHGQSSFMTIEPRSPAFSTTQNASTSSPEHAAAAILGHPIRQLSFPRHRFATLPNRLHHPTLSTQLYLSSRLRTRPPYVAITVIEIQLHQDVS